MVWQIRAGMRFDIVGGYSVLKVDGRASYFPAISPALRLLTGTRTTRSGLTPGLKTEVLAALHASHVQYMLITNSVPDPARIAVTAESLTGCHPQHTSDVTVCAIH